MAKVSITRTAPQKEFMGLKCEFPAFVGGYGTGKSEIMCIDAILDSVEGGAGSLVGLYEPTYDLVKLIALPRIQSKLSHMGVRYKYNGTDKIIYTSSSQIGDFIFRSLTNPERIIGYETFRSKIDEIDTLTAANAKLVFEKILGRNRQLPASYQNKSGKPINTIASFSTPEGFRFLYQRWKLKKGLTEADKLKYQMVQASTYSNPFLPADYVNNLKSSYSPELIKAYLEGQFVNLNGGTVYKFFDRKLNCSFEELDPTRPLLIGMDFNVNPMCAVVGQMYGQNIHIVDELVLNNSDTESMAQEIVRRYPQWCKQGLVDIFPDAAGNQRHPSAKNTDHQILRGYGFNIVVNPSNPRIKDRVNSVNARFQTGTCERYLFVHPRCENVIECLEGQIWADNGEPDKTQGFDHLNDALGYLIWQLFPITGAIFRQRNGR
ncbi:phage terminase large subunit family protein [Vibrio astriarenae]|uniref:phage terminase large subunit family protein n=1 Tax=Vibrio astriarenae TaxID=1481923 RepID=UPI003735BB22